MRAISFAMDVCDGITGINTDAASLGLRIRIARRVELLLYRSFR